MLCILHPARPAPSHFLVCACCNVLLQTKVIANLDFAANSMTSRFNFLAAGGLHGEVRGAENAGRQAGSQEGHGQGVTGALGIATSCNLYPPCLVRAVLTESVQSSRCM